MRSKTVSAIVFLIALTLCEGFSGHENEIEGRGKKKKLLLFVYIADLVVKKIFFLKLFYAFVFWLLIHKAGYLLTFFVGYLKENKHQFHHEHYPHHGYGYGSSYGPYRRQSQRQ